MDSKQWQKVKEVFSATLDLPPGERDAFLKNEDESVRDEVEKLLANFVDAEDFIDAPAVVELGLNGAEDSLNGKKIDDYLILKQIGAGGMGAVYLAEQQSENLSHRVALKLIKRGMDTNSVLKRFVMERQILANLEHPFIARFLDGGSSQDGLPYFVMEYVEGLPVTKYCDSLNLSIEERLELFRQICAAVSFAHRNLIVHRDLKPSNILVGKDGTPKLLDFGIAKILNPDWSLDTAEATATAFRVMTPEYASPEQLKGENVTTASDVYSLGVILYELLTGERPYKIESRSPEEAARVVLTEEPVKPSAISNFKFQNSNSKTKTAPNDNQKETGSEINPKSKIQNLKSLRGDLDNIILKSLRKEPERRYQSVQEFSEDIRRHLEGLPVTATADTAFYRAAKFVKRHKAAVAATVFVVLTLVAATIVTAWQAQRANRERAKAEQRFNDVRRLANAVVFEFHDSIQNLPGSTPTRELLVSRALEYLDKLAAESDQDRSLHLELADAYDRIGDIQGGFNTANLGQRQMAQESYAKALTIKEKLVAAEPANVDFRRKLATGYKKIGDMRWLEADLPGALEFHQKAWAINRDLLAEIPENKEIRLEAALSYSFYGRMLAANGRVQEGLEQIRRSVQILVELTQENPNELKYQEALAFSYDRIGEILVGLTENYAEAFDAYGKSQLITERLLAANPSDTKLRRSAAVGHFNMALVSNKIGNRQVALDESEKAVAGFKQLLAEDPLNKEYQQTTATIQTFYYDQLTANGRASEVIEPLKKTLETFEKSYAASPTDEISHFRIAESQSALARAFAALASNERTAAPKRLEYWREALGFYQKSLKIYKRFQEAGMLSGEESDRVSITTKGLSDCETAIAVLSEK